MSSGSFQEIVVNDFSPSDDLAQDLGKPELRWKEIFATRLNGIDISELLEMIGDAQTSILDHDRLKNRDIPNQHPTNSITHNGTNLDVVLDELRESSGPGDAITELSEAISALKTSKAPLESPNFSGEPTGPTPPTADDSDRLATTAHVKAVVGGIDVSDKAPLPITTTNEIGNWRLIYFANVTSFALPSGGTWAYFLTAANSAQAVTHSFSRAGVAAGGTVVTGTLNTGYGSGFMWRIA